MTELFVGKTQEQSLCVLVYTYIYRKHVWNKLQPYCDGRFNMVVHFYTPYDQTVVWSTDGKRAPLNAISLQAVGSPKEAPPTYIAKMW